MSKTNDPNLMGWAAIITALATLITAIGFPSILPDLARQLLLKDNSTTNSPPKNHDINSRDSERDGESFTFIE